jgi:ABC-type uncharacterized transport system permease subunit
LVFHPLQLYLGRTPPSAYLGIFAVQAFWIVALGAFGAFLWRAGLRHYAAEGG